MTVSLETRLASIDARLTDEYGGIAVQLHGLAPDDTAWLRNLDGSFSVIPLQHESWLLHVSDPGTYRVEIHDAEGGRVFNPNRLNPGDPDFGGLLHKEFVVNADFSFSWTD